MNLCRACGADFASVDAFDRHRVGVHAYTFLEGLDMVPPVEDGRRCLDVDEMRARGMSVNGRGLWQIDAAVERIRRRFNTPYSLGVSAESDRNALGVPPGHLGGF